MGFVILEFVKHFQNWKNELTFFFGHIFCRVEKIGELCCKTWIVRESSNLLPKLTTPSMAWWLTTEVIGEVYRIYKTAYVEAIFKNHIKQSLPQ